MLNKVEDVVSQPDYKHKLVIYSDGNDDYTSVLPEYYNTDVLCYGQKIKSKDGKKIFPAIKRRIYLFTIFALDLLSIAKMVKRYFLRLNEEYLGLHVSTILIQTRMNHSTASSEESLRGL